MFNIIKQKHLDMYVTLQYEKYISCTFINGYTGIIMNNNFNKLPRFRKYYTSIYIYKISVQF